MQDLVKFAVLLCFEDSRPYFDILIWRDCVEDDLVRKSCIHGCFVCFSQFYTEQHSED